MNLLRQQRRAERIALGLPVITDEHGRSLLPNNHNHTALLSATEQTLPDHLGWESVSLTAVLRATRNHQESGQEKEDSQNLSWLNPLPSESHPASPPSPSPADDTIKLYPDVALGMLRQKQAAAGRIWLLLRYLDAAGCGWIAEKKARARLTGKRSGLRVCGRRQLRNLLAQGEGVFWQRRHGRIWLRSVAKVAAALKVWQLIGRPVALPVSVLTQGIGAVRAHFYASFHSGRTGETTRSQQLSTPIARATIEQITSIDARTQRHYEKKANARRRHNYALGAKTTVAAEQEHAWQQGKALFRLTDYKGFQGRPGTTYLAWQLPNSYFGPHVQQPRGRQKRINQELADLFMKGMTGNGEEMVESGAHCFDAHNYSKRFYDNGRLAAKAHNRSAGQAVYWRSHIGKHGRAQLWYFLPGEA